MPTVNERLRDAAVGHAVDLHLYSNGVVRRIMALLNRTDKDLFAQLTAALASMTAESFTVERLESLLASVRQLNAQAYQAAGEVLVSELRSVAAYEAQYQYQLFQSTMPPQVTASVSIAAVNAEQAYTAAMSRPFQGRLLSEWAKSIEASRMTRIRDAIRIGYVQGQTTDEIVRRLRGTQAKGYSDGIIEIDRRHLESVTRTALSHMAGVARDRFYASNSGLVKAVEWVSTLDTHTTTTCSLRDGKRYTNDAEHKPIGHSLPWLAGPGRAHWGCRSDSAPVTKSWRELGIDIDEVHPSTRSSMDGQVPAKTTYGEWLKRQSAARQDEILGPTRGKLLRAGGMDLERFANNKGRWLTLDELRKRDAGAFEKAGI